MNCRLRASRTHAEWLLAACLVARTTPSLPRGFVVLDASFCTVDACA